MSDIIERETFNKLAPSILKNMGEEFIKKAPEVVNAIALISAKKEIALIEISRAVAPVLLTSTDKFISYLKEANELATSAEIKNYDLIFEVIKQHPDARFEEKAKLIKDNGDKRYNFLNKIASSVIKLAGVAAVTILGSKTIEELSACKQIEIKEKGKSERSFWANKRRREK